MPMCSKTDSWCAKNKSGTHRAVSSAGCPGCLAEGGNARARLPHGDSGTSSDWCARWILLTFATSHTRATSGKWATQQEAAQDSVMKFLSFVPFPILY